MCAYSDRLRQHGASRIELAVCTVLFGIFLYVFLDHSLYYQEYGEKTAMEMTAANIRTGLRYKVADLILANRMSEIPALADENPMIWLAEKPVNYLGELDSPPPEEAGGKWYFDRRNRELVYTVNNRRHFLPSVYRDFSVRYRAMRVRAVSELASKQAPGETWVTFALVNDYQWLQ